MIGRMPVRNMLRDVVRIVVRGFLMTNDSFTNDEGALLCPVHFVDERQYTLSAVEQTCENYQFIFYLSTTVFQF